MPIKRKVYRYGRNVDRQITARIKISKGNLNNGKRGVFVACVTVGRHGYRGGAAIVKQGTTCEEGRNPRLALGRAFTKIGTMMKWRGEHGRGAFAAFGRR